MKPSTYNLGSVKVTESSQFYNAKYIKGYPHVYQNGDKPQFQGEQDDGIQFFITQVSYKESFNTNTRV